MARIRQDVAAGRMHLLKHIAEAPARGALAVRFCTIASLDQETQMTKNISYYRTADDDFMNLDSPEVLSLLSREFPAVVEANHASDLSNGYQHMSTLSIAQHLQNQHGLRLVYASQQRSNKRDPRFQEHVLRFQFPQNGPVALQNVGDSVPELVLSNSHNGRSAIKFYAGIFRMVCSNGMVIADADFGRIRQRHFGANAIGNVKAVIEGSARRMALLDARIRKMQEIVLHPHDQNMLARMLMEIRKAPAWLEPGTVLEARREADERGEDGNRSLWTTFNVLQENLSNREIDVVFDGRPRHMKPVHGSMRDLALNEGLWLKMEEFIEDRFPQIYAESLNRDVEEFVPAAEDQDSVPATETPAYIDPTTGEDVQVQDVDTGLDVLTVAKPKRVRSRKQKATVEA